MHGTSLLSTPGQFGPVLLPQVTKNDDEDHCLLKLFDLNLLLDFIRSNTLKQSKYQLEQIIDS